MKQLRFIYLRVSLSRCGLAVKSEKKKIKRVGTGEAFVLFLKAKFLIITINCCFGFTAVIFKGYFLKILLY